MTTDVFNALSAYLTLDNDYEITLQQFDGVNQVLEQEDGSTMAVMTLRITVLYGLKMKI
jgi:lipoprotein NlpI